MKRTKANKGITLVALIITIIVLLILAVVAIGAIKNDGIIDYAKNAKRDYMAEADREKQLLQNALAYINDNVPGQNNSGNGGEEGGTEVEPPMPQEPTVIVVGGPENNNLKDGENCTLTLQTTEGVNVPVTNYESSDSTIATVDSNGTVKGEAPGTATITLTYKVNETTKTKTYDVTVVENVTSMEVTPSYTTVEPGQTIQLNVTTSPTGVQELTTGKIEYESLNPMVATVTDDGLVSAKSGGEIKIQVTYTPSVGDTITKIWTGYSNDDSEDTEGGGGGGDWR